MTRHLSLLSFTKQGVNGLKQSTYRAEEFRVAVEKAGGRIVAQYWAFGDFDGCIIFETPDDQTALRLLLQLAQDGNVRTKTMRVYDQSEFIKATVNLP